MSSADIAANGTTPARVPAVTVLIPAHNAGAFLREAVDSILTQTFTDFECLVIDDGSTDGAVDTLRAIADQRLRIERNPHNLGLIATLNRGLELARAPLLARMDADDIALPQRLERQVAAFADRPRLALLGSCARCITETGEGFTQMNVPSGFETILRGLLLCNAFIHPSVMFRTSVVRNLGGYSAAALHAEDYELWLRLALEWDVDNLPEVHLLYRVHSQQVSQRHLVLQHRKTLEVQAMAWERLRLTARRSLMLAPVRHGLWGGICGRGGTLGAAYKRWAKLRFLMGDAASGRRLTARGLMSAPLSVDLYRLLLPGRFVPDVLLRALARIKSSSGRTTD